MRVRTLRLAYTHRVVARQICSVPNVQWLVNAWCHNLDPRLCLG